MKRKYMALSSIILVLCMLFTACGSPAPDNQPLDTLQPDSNIQPTESIPSAEIGNPTEEPSQQFSNATPLLWHVTSEEQAGEIWLFGSIHVAEESLYPLNKALTDIYEGCDNLAVEMDIIAYQENIAEMMSSMQALIYTDGTTIRDHISRELYENAKEKLTKMGLYNELYDMYKPYFWSALMDAYVYKEAGFDEQLGVDMYFLKKAKEDGKTILEIESAELQYNMLGGFSDELQEYILAAAMEDNYIKESIISLKELYEVWKKGSDTELAALLEGEPEEYTEAEIALEQEYSENLIDKRNIGMVSAAEEYMGSGEKYFYIVGAAHMIGENGLIQSLSRDGYTVQRVEY